jgi:hypothetical protein
MNLTDGNLQYHVIKVKIRDEKLIDNQCKTINFRPELIDELLKIHQKFEDLMVEDRIFKQLIKAFTFDNV